MWLDYAYQSLSFKVPEATANLKKSQQDGSLVGNKDLMRLKALFEAIVDMRYHEKMISQYKYYQDLADSM